MTKLDPSRDAIAVHQMGKVGSTSVYHTLQAALPDLTIYHTHRLNRHTLYYMLRRCMDQESSFPPNLVESLNLIQCLERKKKRVHIVSLVRDPVARNISGFFENIEMWEGNLSDSRRAALKSWLESKPQADGTALPADVQDACEGLQEIFLREYGHKIPLDWINIEMSEPLGIDIYQTPFNKEQGYTEYTFGDLRILFLTLERLNETIGPALSSFLGLPELRPVHANLGEQKFYAPLYKQFIRSVPLPASYLDEMYNSTMARYFYDDSTLELFRQRWMHRTPVAKADSNQPTMNQELAQQEAALLKRHPVPHKLFLPSEKVSTEDRLEGIRKVVDLHENRLEPSREKLRAIREKYLGTQRCFIIGNGPSLNETDLSKLKNEITFGLNGIFLLYDKLGFRPTFYVVEDHLVAEDRADAINALEGSQKIFPTYLRYCIDEGPDTVWINHIPRTRFREGNYDFSTDASKCTYMGCTVTFTALQLAFYFGFKEIYLVGVDSNYEIPKDVAVSNAYNVQTLDMKSDDPNHFHPDYFGKGFRWHDPQVDRMICAYERARDTSIQNGARIFNATKGGKLESFPRVDYDSLFPPENSPSSPFTPKTLIIDLTEIGGESATGQLKAALFSGWDPKSLMQIFRSGRTHYVITPEGRFPVKNVREMAKHIRRFAPEVIYARPVDLVSEFFDFTEELICDLRIPAVVHIMDDWPARLQINDTELYSQLEPKFSRMLTHATGRLSISDAMSEAFGERYGTSFTAIANGVDPREWPDVERKPRSQFLLRYSGSLAPDMGRDSVVEVARLVHELNTSGELSLAFEIYTNKGWMEKESETFRDMRGVSLKLFVPREEYPQMLTQSDALLLAYNFDEETLRYIRYSLANKLPDCLASGTPVIAFGPEQLNTIAYLRSTGVGLVANSVQEVKEHLLSLAKDTERKTRIGRAARCYVFQNHHVNKTKERFRASLAEASRTATGIFVAGPCLREEGIQLEESKLAVAITKDVYGKDVKLCDTREQDRADGHSEIPQLKIDEALKLLQSGTSEEAMVLVLDELNEASDIHSKFLSAGSIKKALVIQEWPQDSTIVDGLVRAGFQVLRSIRHGKHAEATEARPWAGLKSFSPGEGDSTDALLAFNPPIADADLRKKVLNLIGDDEKPVLSVGSKQKKATVSSFADNLPDPGKPIPKLPVVVAILLLMVLTAGMSFGFKALWQGEPSAFPAALGAVLGALLAAGAIAGYALAREISIVRLKIQRLSQLSDRRKAEMTRNLANQFAQLRSSQEQIRASIAELKSHAPAAAQNTDNSPTAP